MMNRRMAKMVRHGLVAVLPFMVALPPAVAWAGQDSGEVVEIDATHHSFMIEQTGARESARHRFQVTDRTEITRGDRAVPFQNLALGGNVVVRFKKQDDVLVATSVEIIPHQAE